jgi:hypothetical protein
MRGKLTVFSNPELEVIDLAPEENEPEKKENRNTPVIRNGIKFSGLREPKIRPKTKPYASACSEGVRINHQRPSLVLALADSDAYRDMVKAKSLPAQTCFRYSKKLGRVPIIFKPLDLAKSARFIFRL